MHNMKQLQKRSAAHTHTHTHAYFWSAASGKSLFHAIIEGRLDGGLYAKLGVGEKKPAKVFSIPIAAEPAGCPSHLSFPSLITDFLAEDTESQNKDLFHASLAARCGHVTIFRTKWTDFPSVNGLPPRTLSCTGPETVPTDPHHIPALWRNSRHMVSDAATCVK